MAKPKFLTESESVGINKQIEFISEQFRSAKSESKKAMLRAILSSLVQASNFPIIIRDEIPKNGLTWLCQQPLSHLLEWFPSSFAHGTDIYWTSICKADCWGRFDICIDKNKFHNRQNGECAWKCFGYTGLREALIQTLNFLHESKLYPLPSQYEKEVSNG
jgi:hypothetical protein